MTFVQRMAGGAALGVAMLIACGLSAPPAQAGYIVTLVQEGPNVVATGSGTIDLAGLSFRTSTSESAIIIPALANIVVGPVSLEPVDLYTGFTGPMDFGSSGGTSANSGSGDIVGISGFGNSVIVPVGYVSGEPLGTSIATWDNATFASLGVTPGSYVWNWGSGPSADSLTLDVGPAAVPEPSSLALLALPLGLVTLLAAWSRRATHDSL